MLSRCSGSWNNILALNALHGFRQFIASALLVAPFCTISPRPLLGCHRFCRYHFIKLLHRFLSNSVIFASKNTDMDALDMLGMHVCIVLNFYVYRDSRNYRNSSRLLFVLIIFHYSILLKGSWYELVWPFKVMQHKNIPILKRNIFNFKSITKMTTKRIP